MKEEFVGWLDDEWNVVLDHDQTIVRCMDCEFAAEYTTGALRCIGYLVEPWDYYEDKPSEGVKVEPDGFCAWAVRRNA